MYLCTIQEWGSHIKGCGCLSEILKRLLPLEINQDPALWGWLDIFIFLAGKAPTVNLNTIRDTKAPERCNRYPCSCYMGVPLGVYNSIPLNERGKKIWVPYGNRTHNLPNTRREPYPLSYENSCRARAFNWVHVWQAFCILLGSALSKSSWVW